MQGGHVTDVKKMCTERHVCGTIPSVHSDVSRYGETTMPDVETDNDAAGDNLQRDVATFFFGAQGEWSEWPPLTGIMNFVCVTVI